MLALPGSTVAVVETGGNAGLQYVSTTYPNTDPFAALNANHGGVGAGTQAGPIVYEAAATGTAVGQIVLQQANDGAFGTLAGFALSGGDSGEFTIDPDGTIRLAKAGAVDYFAGPASFTVTATDTAGRTLAQNVAVAINEADTAPTAIGGALAIASGAAAGTVIGTVHATDREADATAAGKTTLADRISYSLVDSDGGLFAIDGSTGVVRTTTAFTGDAASVSVKATDIYGMSMTQSLAVAVAPGAAPVTTTPVTTTPVTTTPTIPAGPTAAAAYGHASKSGSQLAVVLPAQGGHDGSTLHYLLSVPTAIVDGKTIAAGTLTTAKAADGTESVTFHPNAAIDALPRNVDPVVTFTYTATDENGVSSAPATVTVQVHDAPVAPNETVKTFTATPYTLSHADVLHIIEPTDGEGLHIVKVGAPTHGSVVLESDGDVTFTPDAVRTTAGGAGEGSFYYKVADAFGNVTTGKVTVDLVADKVALGAGNAGAVGTANVDKFVVSAGTHDVLMVGGADVLSLQGKTFGTVTLEHFLSADTGKGGSYVPHDDVEFSRSAFSGQDDAHRLSSLMAHAADDGHNTTITLDAADKVVMAGVHKAQLTLADVHFV